VFIPHTTVDNTCSVVLSECEEVNARAINVGLIRQPAPELVEQCIRAFEKGGVHRDHLGKA